MKKQTSDPNNFKAGKFRIMLYPDDPSHKSAFEYITTHYHCAYILHDKDTITQADIDEHPDRGYVLGEIKKPHWHIVLNVSGCRYVNSLAKEFNIKPNYILRCDSYEKALAYLTHFNNENKYQYSIDEVDGDLKSKLYKIIENEGKDEDERILDLLLYIDQYPGYLSVTMFAYYCQSQGKWDMFRRSASIFINLIREHNTGYYQPENIEEFEPLE